MEERAASTAPVVRERAGAPGASELLRAALEKIVFFEWRLGELSAELAGAQTRAAAAEADRERAHGEARQAALEAQEARRRTIELETERARMASLLARPAREPAIDQAALEAERDRAAQLAGELSEARRELARQKDERARWLQEMIEQARQGDEAPAALAQFISELRSDVIALRDRQRRCDALLAQAGLEPPPPAQPAPAAALPEPENDAVSRARKLWAEGRLGPQTLGGAPRAAHEGVASAPAEEPHSHEPRAIPAGPSITDLLPGLAALQRAPAIATPAAAVRTIPAAQRALVEQCLRGLTASDAARRAQAARHLAALPLPAAAPGLAAALGRESDPRARAAIARALAACGGDGAAALIAQLQGALEPSLVRLAALDALVGMGAQQARTALEAAALDSTPAIRRRAAGLALASGENGDLLARLSIDPDASVRAAAGAEGAVPEAPLAEEELLREPAPHSLPTAPPTTPMTAAPAAPAAAATMRPAAPSAALRAHAPAPGLAQEALFAVRTAMLGLTESDLANALGVELAQAESLAQSLVAQGILARRGRRLIAGASLENAHAERGA